MCGCAGRKLAPVINKSRAIVGTWFMLTITSTLTSSRNVKVYRVRTAWTLKRMIHRLTGLFFRLAMEPSRVELDTMTDRPTGSPVAETAHPNDQEAHIPDQPTEDAGSTSPLESKALATLLVQHLSKCVCSTPSIRFNSASS